jgi:hypothetical protein
MESLYTIKYKCLSGYKKGKTCEVEMFAYSIKEAKEHFKLDSKDEKIISIKPTYNQYVDNKTYRNPKQYTPKYNLNKMKKSKKYKKAAAKKGTAKSKKLWKLIIMPKGSYVKSKEISKTYLDKGKEKTVNTKIKNYAKKCGCGVMWVLLKQNYKSKSFKLYKKSKNYKRPQVLNMSLYR